jgi:hypothetical protein
VVVTAASVPDRDGAKSLLKVLRPRFSRRRRSWADRAYAGSLVDWVRGWRIHRPVPLEIGPRSTAAKGCSVLPKRWVGERSHLEYPYPDKRLLS